MALVEKVLNAGLAEIVNAIIAGSPLPELYAAVGTGTGVDAASTDTTLITEDTGTARVAVTLSRVTTNVNNDTIRATATIPFPSISETVTEVFLVDSPTHGAGNGFFHATGLAQLVGPTNGVPSIVVTMDIPLVPQ